MDRKISLLSVIPMRKEPAHRSEMVNQLLFGETASCLEVKDGWVMLRLDHDGYEGWVQDKQLTDTGGDPSRPFMLEWPVQHNDNRWYFAGSLSPVPVAEKGWTADPSAELNRLRVLCNQFLGAPYLWGGRTMAGFDCSGLVQVIFRLLGTSLPRDASQQVAVGQVLDFVDQCVAGDLAFFDNEEGNIIHVGVVSGVKDGKVHIVHASGEVREDVLDHNGIFNAAGAQYSHKLRALRRIAAFT
ncbi:MAG: C40 family peptidase [Flavobacteriales bacterium]|nr:C40 family peptidase [Flavobacteriales bacterium]